MRFFQGGERPYEPFWDVSMAMATTIGPASVLATRKTGQYCFSDHTLPPNITLVTEHDENVTTGRSPQ